MTAKAIGDGTYPVYVGNGHLMLYDVAAKTLKDVVDAGVRSRSRHAALVARRPAPSCSWPASASYTEAFSFDVASGKYTQLTQQKTLQYGSRSKDGKVVAVTMDSPETPSEIHVTDATFATLPQAHRHEPAGGRRSRSVRPKW